MALPDGGFAVAWESDGIDRRGADSIYLNTFVQRFSAIGGRIGQPIPVNPVRVADAQLQDLVSRPDGGFNLVYASSNVDTNWDVYLQRFDGQARKIGGEALINEDVFTGFASPFSLTTPGYQLAPLADGGFVATFSELRSGSGIGYQIYTQRHDADGDRTGRRSASRRRTASRTTRTRASRCWRAAATPSPGRARMPTTWIRWTCCFAPSIRTATR